VLWHKGLHGLKVAGSALSVVLTIFFISVASGDLPGLSMANLNELLVFALELNLSLTDFSDLFISLSWADLVSVSLFLNFRAELFIVSFDCVSFPLLVDMVVALP